MQKNFATPISAVAAHPVQHNVVVIGFFDGLIKCCLLDTEHSDNGRLKFTGVWSYNMKKSVRGLAFSDDGENLYVICENRALCVFDLKEGRRLRCVQRSHDKGRPHRLIALPDLNRYSAASGSDDGEIRLWDFNSAKPIITTFTDQEESINAFATYKTFCLLSASADGTLGAYDFRRRKLRVKSELLSSELLSLAVTDKYTCVGNGDGHIEVFKNGEFGNIFGRIETSFSMGVDVMVELKPRLLLTGSAMGDEMRFYHVQPHKELAKIDHFGGTDILVPTRDGKYLIIATTYSSTIHTRPLDDVLESVRDLDSAVSLYAEKARSVGRGVLSQLKTGASKLKDEKDNFFYDLISDGYKKNKKGDGDGEGSEEEEGVDDEEDDEASPGTSLDDEEEANDDISSNGEDMDVDGLRDDYDESEDSTTDDDVGNVLETSSSDAESAESEEVKAKPTKNKPVKVLHSSRHTVTYTTHNNDDTVEYSPARIDRSKAAAARKKRTGVTVYH